jgi:hypothetical protein
MKYAKLEQIARALTPEEALANVSGLAADPRFAGVVRLILDQKDLAADFSCGVNFAGSHGALAHAAGVRYGLRELEGKIKQLTDPPKRTTPQGPAK